MGGYVSTKAKFGLLQCLGALSGTLLLGTVPARSQTTSASSETQTAVPRDTTAAESAPSTSSSVAEVVVTARRRQEDIEKVPIAISVLGKDQLQQRSVFSELDLQRSVPGLTIRENGSANQFNYAIRGQSVDTYSASPPGVLPYIDDVQVTTHSVTPFYDLQNIQVLKGPQGTLFGRNTTGGAVLYQTAGPSNQFGGYFDARYGDYDESHVEGAVSLPLTDKASLRLAGSYSGGGAYVYNIASGDRVGDQDVKSLRGTLIVRPIQGLTNTTVVEYTDEGGTNVPSEAYSAYACGQTYKGQALYSGAACLYGPGSPVFGAFIAAHPGLYPGGVAAFTDLERQLGPWTADVNYPLDHNADDTYALNTTSYAITPNLTVKNIFGYNNTRADDQYDYDGTPYPIFQSGAPSGPGATGFIQATEQISDELQLQGKAYANRLTYVVGYYHLHQRDENDSNLYAYDFSPIAPGVGFSYHQASYDDSNAVFGQGTLRIAPRLNFTTGLRYTWEDLSANQLSGSVFGSGPSEHMSASKPSWTVGFDYQATSSLLLYITTRGSWRTGGYNYSVAPLNTSAAGGGNAFAPETTEDVEAGFKYSGRAAGFPVTLNADAFGQWVQDVQRTAYIVGVGGTPTVFTINVPSALINGVEADLTLKPSPWLTLGGAGAYTDARYTNGNVLLQGTALSYGPYADTPTLSGTLYAEATHPLPADAGHLILHVDVYNQTNMSFSNEGDTVAPFTTIPGYTLTNARLSWAQFLGRPLTASLYVRNMFDQAYYAGGNGAGPSLGINTSVPGQPRMYGGEVRLEF